MVQSAGLRIGDRLLRDNLSQAIRRIYATNLFTQIAADTTMVGDGVRILFRVTVAPRLKAVHFLGNHKIPTKDLVAKVGAKEGEVLSEKKAFEWTQKVSDLYKEKGFVLAKITPQKTPPDQSGRVELNFFIEEGERIRIRKVTFAGNQAVPSKALAHRMSNKSFLWPFRSGGFKDEEFKKDLERVTDYYKESAI